MVVTSMGWYVILIKIALEIGNAIEKDIEALAFYGTP
jgi:hypothetical protein